MRTNRLMCVVAVAVLGAMGANAQEKEAREMGKTAAQKVAFVNDLARFDQGQILLGRMAMERSDNVRVQEFGRTLVNNHQQHLQQLETWAENRAMEISARMEGAEGSGVGGAGTVGAEAALKEWNKYVEELEKQDKKAAERYRKLQGLQGAEFDKEFLSTVIEEQKRGEKLIDKGMKEYRADVSLASFLAETKPVIERNKQMAEQVKKTL